MSQLKQIIREHIIDASFQNVTDTESLVQSRLLSSIMVVDLAVALEERFNFKIPFSDITKENFDTVDLLEKYLISKGVKI